MKLGANDNLGLRQVGNVWKPQSASRRDRLSGSFSQ